MDTPQKFKMISYGIKIKAELEQRISNHIRALKHLEGKGYSKQKWMQEAIQEKLQTCQDIDIEKIRGDHTFNFKISQQTHDEIVKIVKLLKKLKIRSSKTDFFIEAILEKLSRDENKVKKLFQDMIKIASDEVFHL